MPDIRHVFFYGTLMHPFPTQERLGLKQMLEFVAHCQVPGRLVDLGRYPGLIKGQGLVQGQIFEILDDQALDALDEFEFYLPEAPERSEYLREAVQPVDRPEAAWAYFLNRDPSPFQVIERGDWPEHLRQQAAQGKHHDFEAFFSGRQDE